MKITLYPAPVLRQRARPVDFKKTSFRDLKSLTDRMTAVMIKADGVGIAAPQIGVSLRIFILAPAAIGGDDPVVFINPRNMRISGVKIEDREGFLSLPGLWHHVVRK